MASRWGKRRLNKVWWQVNRLGEFFVFGTVGSGKDQVITTLAYRPTKRGILKALKKYEGRVGDLMKDVPVER